MWMLLDFVHAVLALVFYPVRFTKWGKERVAFERTRHVGDFTADWAFEVSSEGEFEQVRPFIHLLLSQGSKVEIIYASESVHRAMLALHQQHPLQVRVMPLPLLTHTPGLIHKMVSAPRFVMCRYDFFPSLLFHASKVESGLVWATLKGKRSKAQNLFWQSFYHWFFDVFDWIVPATLSDQKLFESFNLKSRVLKATDWRIPQIAKRLRDGESTLSEKFPHWQEFKKIMEQYPRHKRWIMGSFWEEDLQALTPEVKAQVERGEILVLLVPHKLDATWVQRLGMRGFKVNHVIKDGPVPVSTPGLWVLNLKGVLCELYAWSGQAYVGGGFGRSVHSVLEPFVAGNKVYCGPQTHRSTEVELIMDLAEDRIEILPSVTELKKLFTQAAPSGVALVNHEIQAAQDSWRLIQGMADA